MVIEQGILIFVGLAFLLAASYTDIRRREVPDWLSYGLIFSGLGLRAMFSLESGWGILLDGVLGFLACLGLAYLFYWAGWWGGGDSKLLMGMGAVLGLGLGDFKLGGLTFTLFWFFMGLLLFGAVIGVVWSGWLAVKKRKKFAGEFKWLVKEGKKWHYLAWGGSLVLLGLGLGLGFYSDFYSGYLWLLAVFPAGFFYLFCFVKAVEESCMVKELRGERINELEEGDWLAEEVRVKERKEGKPAERVVEKGKGLEQEEIWRLKRLWREGRLKKVLVKEGIPFVPSFLASYLVVVMGNYIWIYLGKGGLF